MISPKVKGYFREALVARLTFSQIQNIMEQAGIVRISGAGQNYFKGKPSKASLVDEYFKGADNDINGDLKLLEAIKLFISKYKEPNPPIEIDNLIRTLHEENLSFEEVVNSSDTTKNVSMSNMLDIHNNEEFRDVFLCHASKDKKEFVVPFLQQLDNEGITYWYDEAEIKWGDSLVGMINGGLKRSHFVIIFLSKNFFERNWPEKEFNSAMSIEISSRITKVLPLLIGNDEDIKLILEKYPLLADKKYKRWDEGIDSLIKALKIRHGKQKATTFFNKDIDSPKFKGSKAISSFMKYGLRIFKIIGALGVLLAAFLAIYFNMRPLVTSSLPYYDQSSQKVIFSLENRNGNNAGDVSVSYAILSTNEENGITNIAAISNGKVPFRLYPNDRFNVPIPIKLTEIKDHFHLLVLTESSFWKIKNPNKQVFYWDKEPNHSFVIQNIDNNKYKGIFNHYFGVLEKRV